MKKCSCHDNTTRIHDEVMIYEDPMTEKKPEGKATLLSQIKEVTVPGLEYWKVCFKGDDGGVYKRFIKAK